MPNQETWESTFCLSNKRKLYNDENYKPIVGAFKRSPIWWWQTKNTQFRHRKNQDKMNKKQQHKQEYWQHIENYRESKQEELLV